MHQAKAVDAANTSDSLHKMSSLRNRAYAQHQLFSSHEADAELHKHANTWEDSLPPEDEDRGDGGQEVPGIGL